jgi:plastocyanin
VIGSNRKEHRMRRFSLLTAAALATALVLAACGGGGDDGGGDDGGGDGGTEGTTLTLTAPSGAANTGFAETTLSVAADTAFTINFSNQDEGIPHNVQIFEGTDTAATAVWAPEGNAMITGPDEASYEVPALAAGTYTFNCFSHPTTMVGTLTVG